MGWPILAARMPASDRERHRPNTARMRRMRCISSSSAAVNVDETCIHGIGSGEPCHGADSRWYQRTETSDHSSDQGIWHSLATNEFFFGVWYLISAAGNHTCR